MSVLFKCGKGLVTIECFLGCAMQGSNLMYRYFIGSIETADLAQPRTRKGSIVTIPFPHKRSGNETMLQRGVSWSTTDVIFG